MADGSQLIGKTMGTQNSFNLNQALARWRLELAQQGVRAAEANELESHLHDSMKDLQNRGLSEEEGFWIARHRLGTAPELADQFAKADPGRIWKDRIFWATALSLGGFFWMRVWGFSANWFANLLSHAGVPGGWSQLLLQSFALLPLVLAALLVGRGRLQTFCAWVARPFRSQVGLARISVAVLLGLFGVLSIQLLQQSNSAPEVIQLHFPGVRDAFIVEKILPLQALAWKGQTDFWGTLLANAAWPATLVILMFSAVRRREASSG